MRLTAEDDQQHGGQRGEHEDAVGEHEALTERGELSRHEAVTREKRREPREVGERRVGGKDEDQRGGRLDQIVEDASPEEAARNL